ncbi:MAG TPA: hypothetical protein VGF61_06230 [Candidatus Acidoferrum sp.]|jgi:uncharacterized membrane protein
MPNVSHDFSQFPFALLVLSIPGAVFWPYFAGAAILVIGLASSIRNRVGQASGLDKFILFGPLSFAIGMAIFGADHLVAAKFVATVVPSWMPGRLFWAYFVGFALLAAALSLATAIRWRLAAALLGIMIFIFVLTIHLPNLLAAPHEKTRLTIFLRDLLLSAGALAFGVSQTGLAHAPRANASLRALAPKLIAIARFVIAICIAVYGVDHFLFPTFAPGFPQEGPAIITMPAWIPAHVFWAYLTGGIFIGCALGLLSRRYARLAATILGITALVLILFVYLPLTIAKASDIANGLNYLAIHFALVGAAFFLAEASPTAASEPAAVPEVRRSGVRQVPGS